jgi:MFS family permease
MWLWGACVNLQRDPPRHRYLAISILGITQIFAWGATYYLPAVIAQGVSADTGWSLEWVVGGLSLGLLAAGLVSPYVGTAIDRSGGRDVLAFSACCIAGGLLTLAAAPNLALYVVGWLVIGLGMGAGLYDAAFATLGRLYGHGGRSAITMVTLFGGFASTICWPISAFLLTEVGWRGTCVAYATVQLVVALPLYLFFLPRKAPLHVVPPASETGGSELRQSRVMLALLLATTLTLASLISSVLSVHLLNLLQSSGMTLATAVAFGALVGPSQVGARAIEMVIARYHHPIWTKVASASLVALGVTALYAKLPIISVALMLYGAGIGLESIARGTVPLALFGSVGYATLMGRLAMPSLLAQAIAPFIGALLLARMGADTTTGTLAGIALLNVVLACCLAWLAAVRRAAVN